MKFLGTNEKVIALAIARMADSVGNSFLILVLPLYIGSGVVRGDLLGLSESLIIGVVLSVFGFFNSFLQPFTGRLSDRTARRKVFILIGLAVLAVTNVGYSFAHTYMSVLALRAIQGIGVAFTIPTTLALVNELASAETRGGNMGIFNTFRLIGFGAGPVAAGAIVEAGPYHLNWLVPDLVLSGFDAAFFIAALTAVAGILLVSWLVHDPDTLEAHAGTDLKIAVRDPDGGLDAVFTVGLATLFMAVAIALLSAIENQVNARLTQGPTMFGVQFAAFLVPQVLFQAPIGRASDKWGRRPFILWGLLLLAPATLAQGLVTTSWGLVAARLVQGLAGAMVFAPALSVAGDMARRGESGTKLSVLTMGFGLGLAFGPLVSGFFIRYGFVVPFIVGAALSLLAVVLVYLNVEETAPRLVGGGSEPA